ncbi:AbrB/MazE/SpoVT family DNA-binding domain-containing protein [Thiomicrorhabdus sp. Kp2]|uniref:AbrB/MazE/SpoVT family DNA-binding domain-containing protein n=1 Tax=Thiomicrorhabdus sp. Kp2 TaxID=1123518 RepID=UPI0003F9FE27|nr:AbrB/MazE/SpoVT family DNA-binding domain-containing protein [Thiomicrorhabdus sp. Kp2]
MQTTLRKIGNSRGVIIPSALIEQLHLENEIELVLQEGALLLKPLTPLRQDWFKGYDASQDVEPLGEMKDLDSEQEDWEW